MSIRGQIREVLKSNPTISTEELTTLVDGANKSALSKARRELGLGRKARETKPLNFVDLGNLYESGLSTKEITKIVGLSVTATRDRLIGAGVKLRSSVEGRRLAFAKGRRFKGRKGKENPRWRGGRLKRTDGYIEVYAPDHPRVANRQRHPYVMEHILVWEEAHGMSLPPGWVVHHLNGIRDDNRPENLLGLSSKKHSDFIPKLQERIKELESKLAAEVV